MNPSTAAAPQPAPPPPPPSAAVPAAASCPRHPQEHLTPFCPLCLCERLSLIESSSSSASSSRKPPSAAASALKAIFKPSSVSANPPHLRRSHSFSASKNEPFSSSFEPLRKSCDVRVPIEPRTTNLEPQEPPNALDFVIENRAHEIVPEEEEEEIPVELEKEEFKPMKDHIDLDSNAKKPTGSFWSAASVLSKKLQKWRDSKQKGKKQRSTTTLPVEKPIGRHFRETQSEIADYGFGRRSCDIDPRFSLDIGRMSFDDPRHSFDEPRASWDGYLISRTFPKMPTMLSVVEDAPVNVFRSDGQIPVEDSVNSINEDENTPGGSSQTRDYYSGRRKSLDRSNSIRKTAAAVVAEIDEMKSVSNAKVSPAMTEISHRDSNSNSLRDDCSNSFNSGFNDNAGNRKDESKKSRRWGKGWSIWGLINRRGGNKDEEEERESRPNGIERSYSGSWPELRGDRSVEVKGGFNPKMFRSNSSVSWRSSSMVGGPFTSGRKSNADSNGNGNGNGNGKKKKEQEPVLERNRSARHSPTNVDNGLLRFYMAPMKGSRRGGSGKEKTSQAQSIARSVLRLY